MLNFSSFPLPAALVRTLLALILLALRMPSAAQAPAWQSAQAVAVATAVAGSNFSTVRATAVDAAGNVYLAGNFRNTVALGGITLTSFGGQDVFVAKFNPASNQFVWAQRAGGIGDDEATAVAVSGTNVYVAGYFTSTTMSFGPVALINAGSYDGFVAKLTDAGSTGSFAWAQRTGSTGEDIAYALAVSGTSVYVAGSFNSPTMVLGPTALTSAGSYDGFVAKLTDAGSTGTYIWAQRVGGTTNDQAQALAVSGTSVYVAGYFDSPTASFGSSSLASAGGRDVFVTKLTDAGSTGSFAWTQQAGGIGYDEATAVAVSGTNVYVAGYFGSPTAGFGPVALTNEGNFDGFVAKLTDAGSTGSFAWAQRAGGTGEDQASALAVSGTNVYVAGYFISSALVFGPTTLTGTGSPDVFVAKLTDAGSTGTYIWAQRAGGTSSDDVRALAVSGTSVYVVGSFNSPTADFGTITLTNASTLGFLASLTDPTLTATAPSRTLTPAALFPNPAHHTATLRLPAGTTPAPFVLTDALGRAVRRYPAPAGPEAALDLQGLPAGLYLLRGVGPAQRLAVE